LFEQGVLFPTDLVSFYVRLKLSGIISKMNESRLPKTSECHDAACHGKDCGTLLALFQLMNVDTSKSLG
jgi:hypothetical protein